LDVASNQGGRILSTREVRGFNVETKFRYQDFDLEFKIDQPMDIEVRVLFRGRGALWVDRVDVTRLDVQNAGRSEYPAQGSIVFQSNRDGRKAVYRMDPDGSRQTRLANMESDSEFPRLSPDGKWVAFQANPGGNADVYVMPVEGGIPQRLTKHPAFDGEPAWSPDGRQIYFVSDRDGDFRRIYRMQWDGSDQKPVTQNTRGLYGAPAVSPDGRWLAASSDLFVNWQIHLIDLDGGRERRLTGYAESSCVPSWSQDGQRIFYSSRFGGMGRANLGHMRRDGDEKVQLTQTPSNDYYGVYSPDGRWIVFASDRDGDYEINVMRSDGTGRRQLTFNSAEDTMPHGR
jgi:TolB protein